MANYECVFMTRPEVSVAQIEALTTEFTEIVTTRGGDVAYNEYWGLRSTAYRVKKNRKAHYVLMHVSASSDAMDEMHRIMGLNEDILRTLTTRVDEFEETPTIQMRQKSWDNRDSRGSRDGRDNRDSRDSRDSRGPRSGGNDRPQREDRGYRSRPGDGHDGSNVNNSDSDNREE